MISKKKKEKKRSNSSVWGLSVSILFHLRVFCYQYGKSCYHQILLCLIGISSVWPSLSPTWLLLLFSRKFREATGWCCFTVTVYKSIKSKRKNKSFKGNGHWIGKELLLLTVFKNKTALQAAKFKNYYVEKLS